jgi:hypothetical protein
VHDPLGLFGLHEIGGDRVHVDAPELAQFGGDRLQRPW